jgi:diguanylate cyclase (GGDEF)-like protein
MHQLLKRQLKRLKIDPAHNNELRDTLSIVSDTYNQNERTIKMLERSLFLTSNELNERNRALKLQLTSVEQVQSKLEESLALLKATFDATGEIILVYDLNGEIVSMNKMANDFLAHFNVDVSYAKLSKFVTLLKDPNSLGMFDCQLKENPLLNIQCTVETISGCFYDVRSLPQIKDNRMCGRVWCLRDVTQSKRNEAMVEYQAYHDALTGLPNRSLLIDRVKHALSLAKRGQQKLAVLYIDLDNFKKVNDSEGHDAGDRLLIEVVQRLQSQLREQDTLSRQGGDEFVILLENIKDQKSVAQICRNLINELQRPFTIKGRNYRVTSSIGISVYPNDGKSADEVLRKADMAMYESKACGKNAFRLYSHDIEAKALEKLSLEQALRNVLEREGLSVAFQPKVDLDTMTISGVEALARWYKNDGSSVPPDLFINIAEQTGLIEEVGRQIISLATDNLCRWRAAGLVDITVSINLSSLEFQNPNIIQYFLTTLQNKKIPGSAIIIELTESIFMEDKIKVTDTMKMLGKYGITFALDDFGKGYSSFSYLHALPLQYLKIDKAFLRDVESNPQSATITETIIDIGHKLGLKVIAEGIEDNFILDYVRQHNCDIGQGFHLFKPMKPDDVTRLLMDRHLQPLHSM